MVRGLLTHWGRVTHICVSKLTVIGSDNGLSPGRRQAIISTNAGILLIGPLGTNFSEILIEIHTFSFKKMHLKVSSGKWRPSCLGLNVLNVKNVNYSSRGNTKQGQSCKNPSAKVQIHWNGNVFILMKFSSLAALEVVKMTTSSAASD